MPALRTNWLSKTNAAGFYLLTALLLIATSFLIFISKTITQKFAVLAFLVYFLALLLKKYRENQLILLLLAVFFFLLAGIDQRESSLKLTPQSQLELYPDQVKVKDHYLTGTGHYAGGQVLLSGKITKEQEKILRQGQPVLLTQIKGQCLGIEPATNVGEFDFQNYYASKKIKQKIKFSSCEMALNFTSSLKNRLHADRFYLQQFFKQMPRLLGFFASELILGENNASENQEILNNYRDLGVIHLLSISGLHVGIYVLVVSTLCYYLKLTEEKTFLACGLVLLLGIFLSAGQAGFVRASLTYLLSKINAFKKLHLTGVDLLGLTAIIHLLIVPRLFMSTGALLSYLLAMGLQLTKNFKGLKQSLLLNLLLTPLLLKFFFQVNLLTVIFNLLIIPYFNWIVLPLTFGNLLTFGLTKRLAPTLEQGLTIGEKIIGRLSATKLGLLTFGQINWWQCLLLLLLTTSLIIYLSEKPLGKFNCRQIGFSLLATYGIFFGMIHFPLRGQVTFIDVGQGDSILVTTPLFRRSYLIDTGGRLNFSGKKITPQINRITIPFLKAQGIEKLDGVFVSHQDADHVGDLGPLLEQVQVKKLYLAKGLLSNPSFQKRIAGRLKHTQIVELLAGDTIKEPKITFNVVYPYQPGKGENKDSLSLFFNLAGKNWLFTGDLGQAGEKEISEKSNLQVDYFKLGHHGSKTSSNPDFLQQIQPEQVFISAGRHNRFGHPHPETLATLTKQGIPWVSTQDCGMISWYYGGWQKPEFTYFLKRGKK